MVAWEAPRAKPNNINATAQVVGAAETEARQTHAFLWDAGVMHDLGTPPGYEVSEALDLNHRGQIVGYARADPP